MVDMHIGACSCEKGTDGSPCAHQSAVVARYKIKSVNTFPSLSALSRQTIAKVALGDNAMARIDFYASIHQEKYDHDTGNIASSFKTSDNTHFEKRRVMAKIQQNYEDDYIVDAVANASVNDTKSSDDLEKRLHAVMVDTMQKLDTEDHQFIKVSKSFLSYRPLNSHDFVVTLTIYKHVSLSHDLCSILTIASAFSQQAHQDTL